MKSAAGFAPIALDEAHGRPHRQEARHQPGRGVSHRKRRRGQDRNPGAAGSGPRYFSGDASRSWRRILHQLHRVFRADAAARGVSDQVIAHFPPLSYLLTSENYPPYLRQSLIESIPDDTKDRKKLRVEIDTVVSILEERKEARARRRLSVVNFVCSRRSNAG